MKKSDFIKAINEDTFLNNLLLSDGSTAKNVLYLRNKNSKIKTMEIFREDEDFEFVAYFDKDTMKYNAKLVVGTKISKYENVFTNAVSFFKLFKSIYTKLS